MSLSGELVATLPFDPSTLIQDLKRELACEPSLGPEQRTARPLDRGPRLELVHRGDILQGDRSVAESGVEPGASITLVRVPRMLLLSTAFDRTVRLWDVFAAEGGPPKTLCETKSSVTALCLEPGGSRLLAGSASGTLQLMDLGTGSCLSHFEGHWLAVSSIVAAWTARKFVSASWDTTLALWGLDAGPAPLRTFKGHSREVTGASVQWEAQLVASISIDGTLRFWDIADENHAKALVQPDQTPVMAMQMDWPSRRALVGLKSGVLRLWDASRNCCVREFDGHDSEVWSLDADWHGHRALSASADATVRLWDLATGQALHVLFGHTSIVWRVVADWAAGRAISTSHDLTLRVWDLHDPGCVCTLEGHEQSVICAALV